MILLKNCFALYPDPADPECKPLHGVDVLIQDNLISRIGEDLAFPKGGEGNDSHRSGTSPGGSGTERPRTIDASRCVVIPGFVNTHHHFYQVLTRNIPAVQNAKLFPWLVYLYEVWKNIDEEAVLVSSQVAMGELAKTGCTCTTDHHYLYPRGFAADLMGLQFEAADRIGMRFSPPRARRTAGCPRTRWCRPRSRS